MVLFLLFCCLISLGSRPIYVISYRPSFYLLLLLNFPVIYMYQQPSILNILKFMYQNRKYKLFFLQITCHFLFKPLLICSVEDFA